MAISLVQLEELIEQEMLRIPDPKTLGLVRSLLVTPRCENRPWGYGEPGETHPCWIVAEHKPSNTGFAYCDQGFGPGAPWGLIWLSGDHLNMGMDSSWFCHLEEAIRDSFAWNDGQEDGTRKK